MAENNNNRLVHAPNYQMALLAMVATLTATSGVEAQDFGRDLAPDRNIDELQRITPGLPEVPTIELPPAEEVPAGPNEDVQKVKIDRVKISGNTVIPLEELEAIAAKYTGRNVSLEELFGLQDALTNYYYEKGYLNSGALLVSGQEVGDGEVEYEIIEGKLTDIRINGLDIVNENYLRERIRQGAGDPFNRDDLTGRIRVLLLEPDFERIGAELFPGTKPGEAELQLEIREGERYALNFEIANDQSPSIGETQARLFGTLRSILGRTDRLNGLVGINEGLRQAQLAYEVPLTAYDLRAYINGRYSESKIISGDLDDLDIESQSFGLVGGLKAPIVERADRRIGLELSLGREHQETELLGEPFDFSPGSENGEVDLTVARLTGTWLERSDNSATSIAATLSKGFEGLGASESVTDETIGKAKSDFVSVFLQGQHARRLEMAQFGLTDSDQLLVRGSLQLTPDPLFSSETFAAGGLDSVRGFRINEISGDNGIEVGLEYRYALSQALRDPNDLTSSQFGDFQLVAFVDAGAIRDDGGDKEEEILAAGAGIIWTHPRFTAELYGGGRLYHDLEDGKREDDSAGEIQDVGIGFRLIVPLY